MISLDDQIKAVEREIGMRHRVYPRFVENKKMSAEKAAAEMDAMKAVLETLKRIKLSPLSQVDMDRITHGLGM